MSRRERFIPQEQMIDLSGGLLPKATAFRNRFPPAELAAYEHGLDSVVRMKAIREQGFPIPPEFKESNLLHTGEVTKILGEFSVAYPGLNEFIDFGDSQIEGILHDCGEIVPVIDDVQPLNRTARDDRRKKLEPIAARKFILGKIADPMLRQDALAYYNRYIENNPFDLETQMAHLADKIQGVTRRADVIFDVSRARKDKLGEIKQHVWQMVPRLLEPALNLLVALPTPETRQDIKTIVLSELDLLAKAGHPEIADVYGSGIREVA